MSKGKQAVKSVIVILVFTMLSKVLGFVRELTIAAKFGLGSETDTFFIAVSAITMVGNIIIVSLNTTFIPVLVEAEEQEGRIGKNRHASNALGIVLVAAAILVIFVEVSAPVVVKILAPGFVGGQMEQLIWYLRHGAPVIFVTATMGITRGYLQSEMRFFETATSNVSFNIVYLTYLFLLAHRFDITKLIFVHLLARVSQLLMQIRPLHQTGFKYIPIFDLKDTYIRRMAVLILPVLIGVAVQDLNYIVDKSLASGLMEGSISALNYSVRINTLVQAVFVTAITTVLFPLMTRAFSRNNIKAQVSLIRRGFVTIVMIAIPAMIAIMMLNKQIIAAAFMRGKFDQLAVNMTAGALFFYAVGLVPMALRVFFEKVFYSIHDTKTPLFTALITLISNFILSIILMQFMSYRGLALGTSISITITVGFMIRKLSRKSIRFLDRGLGIAVVKIVVASLIMGVVVLALRLIGIESFISSSILVLMAYAVMGVVVYFSILKMLKIEELDWFINSLLIKLSKSKNQP